MTVDGLLRSVAEWLSASGIPFMLTGSVASAYYGAGRATMDIDLVIDPTPAELADFLARVTATGAYVSEEAAFEALTNRTMFNVVDPESGWKADLIVRKNRPFSEMEFSRRKAIDFFGVPVTVASVEDVMLSKLEWAKLGGSSRQLEDVRALNQFQLNVLDQAYLREWIERLDVRAQWGAVINDIRRE